uniref:Uncharacterized protein n=1 Tax=Arundo donax TaxID=35708 RepID=A0A0A9B1Q1_ARUDO
METVAAGPRRLTCTIFSPRERRRRSAVRLPGLSLRSGTISLRISVSSVAKRATL